MGIEKLTVSLLTEAKKRSDEIIKSAEANSDKAITEEKAKLAVLIKKTEESVAQIINEQRKERIAWARLEAKRIISDAKEDAIKSTLEYVFGLLEDLRKKSEYKEFLKMLIPQAVQEIRNATILQGIVVYCRKEDKVLIQSIIGNSTSVKLQENSDFLGGVIIESSDGKIKMNVTLEAVFETKRENLRKIIYEKLFSKEEKAKKVLKSEDMQAEKERTKKKEPKRSEK